MNLEISNNVNVEKMEKDNKLHKKNLKNFCKTMEHIKG